MRHTGVSRETKDPQSNLSQFGAVHRTLLRELRTQTLTKDVEHGFELIYHAAE